jgi:hypothetical protein
MSSYPTSLQDLDATRGTSGQPLSSPNHITQHALEDSTIEALQAKLGINNSADTTSIDYLLKNTSSIDPGHKHTAASLALALSNLSDVLISSPADGNGLIFNGAGGKWENASTSTADASTTVKGVTKLDTTPASPVSPIAVGVNSAVLTTASGTGTSAANKIEDQLGFQKGTEIYAVDSAGTDAYAVALIPTPAAYVAGMTVRFKAGTANTAAATLNVNSLGTKTIKRPDGNDLATGDILSGQIVEVSYDGTNFQLLSPLTNKFSNGLATYIAGTASGTQTIAHSLGVIPKKVTLTARIVNSALSPEFSIGHWDAIAQTCFYFSSQAGGNGNTSTSFSIFVSVGNSDGYTNSGVVTVDATNITITWTRVQFGIGGVTLSWDISWEAFA